MKYFYFSLLIIFTFNATAQITIETADLPVADKQFTLGIANGNDLDFGMASMQAQLWDYSGLSTFALKEFELGNVTDFDGAEDFPNATMARTTPLLDALGVSLGGLLTLPLELPLTNSFYGINSSGGVDYLGVHTELYVEGVLEGDSTSIEAMPPLSFYPTGTVGDAISGSSSLLLQAPVNEGIVGVLGVDDINLDSLGIDLSIIQAGILIEIESDVNIDAYGALKMPNKDYNDVLRYKEDLTLRLAIGAYLGSFELLNLLDTTITATQYRFWAKELNHPVLTMLELEEDGELSVVSTEYLYTPTPVTANFDYTVDENNALLIQFNSTSTGDNLSYSWNFGDGGTSNQPSPIHLYDEGFEGTVILTVTDLNDESATFSQDISVTTTSNTNILQASLAKVYPSPTNGLVTIELPINWQTANLMLYNVAGKLVSQQQVNNNGIVDFSILPTGVYFMELKNDNELVRKTVVVEK